MSPGAGIPPAGGGASRGRPPLGTLSPSVEPLHPRIVARYFNILRYRFAEEFAFHKQVLTCPNPAPVGVQFVASTQKSVTPGARGVPALAGASPDHGFSYIGAQEGKPIPT